MNINVSPSSRSHFWTDRAFGASDPGSTDWWPFSFMPPCRAGDTIVFRFDGVPVARAVVLRCEGARAIWGVVWKRSTFEDIRHKPEIQRELGTTAGAAPTAPGTLFGDISRQGPGRKL